MLVTGANDKHVVVHHLVKHDLHATMKHHTDVVGCVAFSPDGSMLATSSVDNRVYKSYALKNCTPQLSHGKGRNAPASSTVQRFAATKH